VRNQLIEKLGVIKENMERGLQKLSAKFPKLKPGVPKEIVKADLEKPVAIAYQLVGDKSARFLPLFKDLDLNLQRSGLKVNFKAYVSLTILASFLITLPVAIITSLLLFSILNVPIVAVLLFGVGAALFTWVLSIFGFSLYPVYLADKHKRELDDELPFTTGYMAILASAGVPPEKIFHSLSTLKTPLAASSEANDAIKHINLFGLDVISALEKVSSRTPSEKLRDTLEGMISTIHTGGNLGAFLREKFKTHMKLKRMALKKYADNLSVLSEIYVALLLTGPLLLIIMFSVMSMLGGGGLGVFSSNLLLNLMTYIGIPVCAMIFLVILDSTSPKW
jgi:flagellar protein FlaJ